MPGVRAPSGVTATGILRASGALGDFGSVPGQTGATGATGATGPAGPSRLVSYTVATLPGAPTKGDLAAVTDATAPTFLGLLVGGGTTYTPVVYAGAAWVSF